MKDKGKDKEKELLYKATIEKIKKQHKYSVELYKASEIPETSRIRSGILLFDLITEGGIPVGRFTGIYGKKSSGKTFLVYKIIVNAQKLCRVCYKEKTECGCKKFEAMRVLFIDSENVFEKSWAGRLGINLEELAVIKPVVAEEMIDVVYEFLVSGDIDLVCLDSLAELQPIKENENEAVDWTQALLARLVGRMIRKWVSAMNERFRKSLRSPTIIITNQIRTKLGTYVPTDVTPGGLAPGFCTAMEIKMWAEKPEKEGKSLSFGKPEWENLCFYIDKNKIGTPHVGGQFKLIVADDVMRFKKAGDVYEEEDALGYAIKLDLVESRNGKYYIGKEKFDNHEQIIDYWMEHPVEFNKIKNEILKMVLEKKDEKI